MLPCLLRVVFLCLASCLLAQTDSLRRDRKTNELQAEFPAPPPISPQAYAPYYDISQMTIDDIVAQLKEAKQKHILAVCGGHPLQAILDKIEGKLEHDDVVKLLSSIRYKAARLWKAYENALRKYSSCKLMAGGGTLG